MSSSFSTLRRTKDLGPLSGTLLLLCLSLLPPIWSSPGRIAADTKSYLMIDPWSLMRSASSLWNPSIGLGTVTHQYIGYLFPMGTWWGIADLLSIPDWVTQRLWWGCLVACASIGAQHLGRSLGLTQLGSFTVGLTYGWSPYVLAYISRISAILLPWAVFPLMIIVIRNGLHDSRRWRTPAQFGLLVLVSGSVNATSIAFVVMGAAVWAVVEAERWRSAVALLMRCAVCSFLVSLWWVIALVVQSRFGLDILRFTETYETIKSTTLPSELLRGFGYWFSYGGDWMDPWVGATYGLLAQPWYLLLGLAIATCSLLGLRGLPREAAQPAVWLVLVGLAAAIGSGSTGRWSPWGMAFQWSISNGPGLVLRSTQRALPVLVLGLALGLAGFVERGYRNGCQLPSVVPLVAVAVQALPWFVGGIATEAITRSSIPDYWYDAAEMVGDDTSHRVWITPGSDFASYRWGGTIDPVFPGLTERPTVARELIPLGTAGSADLMSDIERRIAENTLSPEAIVPLASLLSVDTVIARNDLEFERYALARPDDVTERLDASGLTKVYEGPDLRPDEVLVDEQTFGGTPGIRTVPALAVWSGVAPSIVTMRDTAPINLNGSGATIVTMAELGMIDGSEILFDADSVGATANGLATWNVYGDSNRREDRRWYSIGGILGATQQAGERSDDESLDMLGVAADVRSEVVSQIDGGFSQVSASSYGSEVILSAEDRPEHALDGDPFTAWRGAALESTDGLTWSGTLTSPSTPTWLKLLQPVEGERTRWITEVSITLHTDDGEQFMTVALDDRSRQGDGQLIQLDGSMLRSIDIEVISDSVGPLPGYGNSAGVGFAEITLEGVPVSMEWIVLPPPSTFSGRSERETYIFDRRRIDESIANRFDPEPQLRRVFSSTDDLTMRLSGSWSLARVSNRVPVIESSPSLRGVSELLWVSEFDPMQPWVVFDTSSRAESGNFQVTFSTNELVSAVRSVRITDGGGLDMVIDVAEDGVIEIPWASLTSDELRLDFTEIAQATTVNRFADELRVLPIAIERTSLDDGDKWLFPTDQCVSGVLEIDGDDVPIQIFENGFLGCDTVALRAGTHRLMTTPGHISGLHIDSLVLDSGSGLQPVGLREVSVDRSSTRMAIEVEVGGKWLVVNESFSKGWSASLEGVDLGEPLLVNGYAMAWWVPESASGVVILSWDPQRWVNIGLLISATMVLGIFYLALRKARIHQREPSYTRSATSRRTLSVASIVLFGLPALLAWPLRRCAPRTRLVLGGLVLGPMWLWTSVRQVRWDMPVDIRWPSSMSWAQWGVILIVVSCCWSALDRE